MFVVINRVLIIIRLYTLIYVFPPYFVEISPDKDYIKSLLEDKSGYVPRDLLISTKHHIYILSTVYRAISVCSWDKAQVHLICSLDIV